MVRNPRSYSPPEAKRMRQAIDALLSPEALTTFPNRENYLRSSAERIACSYCLFEPLLGKGCRVLDVGGEHGYMGYLIETLAGDLGCEYVLLEGEHVVSDRFEVRHTDLDGGVFPVEDKEFDLVVNMEVIEHLIRAPFTFIKECNRALKPNGQMFLTTPNLTSVVSILNILRGRAPMWNPIREDIYARHNKEYTIEELRLVAGWSGFSVCRDLTNWWEMPFKQRALGKLLRLTRLYTLPAHFQGADYIGVWRKSGRPKEGFPPGLFMTVSNRREY